MKTEKEQNGQLSKWAEELQNERSRLEVRLQEERQSASRGMELLTMAQEKLASLFKPVRLDAQSASGGAMTNAPPEVAGEVHVKADATLDL